MSYADKVFRKNLAQILIYGVSDECQKVRTRWEDGRPAYTKSVFGLVNRYDLSKEFPIITLRRTYWKSAWDEISWIWQKHSNNVNDLNSHVWDLWTDTSGSIGKAYGYQMGKKSAYKDLTEGGLIKAFGKDRYLHMESTKDFKLNQTDRVIYQLVNDPTSRRIMTMLWNVDDLHEMNLAPCAYSMTFTVIGNKLNGILNQRSQDMITANNWNVVQYALILYSMASAYGFEPGELIHVIANAHIYDRHIDIAKELLNDSKIEEFDAPKFTIDKSIKNFYDFTKDSFTLTDYKYNEFNHKIPVAI